MHCTGMVIMTIIIILNDWLCVCQVHRTNGRIYHASTQMLHESRAGERESMMAELNDCLNVTTGNCICTTVLCVFSGESCRHISWEMSFRSAAITQSMARQTTSIGKSVDQI